MKIQNNRAYTEMTHEVSSLFQEKCFICSRKTLVKTLISNFINIVECDIKNKKKNGGLLVSMSLSKWL